MDSTELKQMAIKLTLIENEIKDANDVVKALKAEKTHIEQELITALQDNGGMGCSWEDAGIRIGLKTLIVPTVKDWEAAVEYILENDLLYLFNHSIKSEGWRELRAQGIEVAGVIPFEKITLSKTKYTK